MSDESTVTLRGRFVDDISPGVAGVTDTITNFGKTATASIERVTYQQDEHSKAVMRLSGAIENQITTLKAQKTILMDPAEQKAIQEAAVLRVQVDNVTRSILSRVAGTRENIAMVKAEADAEAAAQKAANAWRDQVAGVTQALAEQNRALLAQQQAMKSPEYQEHLATNKKLKEEIGQLSKATQNHDTIEKGVFSNMRTRREALVMAHEAMMGRTKNLMGSAMVFAEYADLSIMHTITSMINPTTIAIAAVTAATIGATVALYEMTEKAAEHWHAMSLIAEETGTTTMQMIAFEHAAIGTGVTTKTLATAFERFTLNLGKHREELERVGVTAKDPIQAFEQLMDVAKRTTDPIERNRILSDALGGSWRQLAPLVMQGGDALRDAVAEMKIPKDVQEDYEKINKLEIEMAKNWDLIKKNSGSAMSSIMVQIKEFKSELIAIAAQKGLMAGILAALNPRYHAESSLEIERQKSADAWFRNGPGTVAAGSSLSHDDQDALAKLIEKNKKEIRKNSMADALKDEQALYQSELDLLKRGGQATEDEERAHAMRIAGIRKSFAKGSKTKGVSGSEIEGLQSLIAEKSLENSIRAQMEMEGIDKSVQNAIISKDKEVAAAQEKYRKLESTKGISAAQMKSLEALEAAEIFEIVKKGNAQILAASDEADAKDAAKASASSAKRIAALNKEAAMRATLWTREEKRKQSHDERMRKIQEMQWDIQREHEEHNAKMVEGAWTSAAQGIQGVFSSAFQEIGKKNGDMMQVMADGFENLINKMIADLAANAAIFGLLSLVAPEGLAASFAANAGGLTGAIFGQKSTMLPSFDVGTRGLASDGALYGHKDEAIFPAPVSRAMHAGDWGPAMRFMGQGGGSNTSSTSSQTNHITVNVAGTNASPDDIAKSISRALQVQQRKGDRSSF